MSIPITSLGSQVYVQLPGVPGQVHEPCQDMHICGTCKLSFANVESFLTHKKTVCGKEVSETPYEISVPTTSASAPSQSSSAVSIQTILQHPAPTFITAPANSGSIHHISEEIPLRGQILRVLLGNNEFLFEKTEEMNSIGDLIPEETLQILPDLQGRKGTPEKVHLNGDSHEKMKPVAEKSEIPEMQAASLENDDRADKTQHQSIACERKEQIFQHEENVVSLLASQLGNTSNSLEKQGCSYPEAVVNEQSLCGVSSSPSGGLPAIHSVNDSSSSLKCKPSILARKVRGKNSEDTVFSINISTEKNGVEKSKGNPKKIRQEVTTKLFPEGEDITSRKRMPGMFKQRKIHMCAVEACEFSTTFTKDLIRHMRKHTGERPFKCDKCSRWFSRVDKLRTHLRIHAGLKPHACKLCEYKAVDSGSLRKHMRVHTKERPYRCQICEYSARDSSQLTVHLRTHTGDHPFVCSHASCSAAFKTSSDLKRHERTHTGEKPFQCELCPYKCAISSNLKAHVRLNHSKNKTWLCSTCSYSASSKSALKEHEKTHAVPAAEGDPFKCKICGVTFSDSESFSSHLKTNPHCANSDSATKTKDTASTAQKKPFQCSDCDFSCMQRGNLKNHIQRKHCIAEDNGKRKSHGSGSKGATKGKGGRQSNGAGQPFCLRSHHCPLCNASFVREDSWRSHVRQHQNKGEGLDIPLGPMMPSLVDSSEVNLISKVQGNSRVEANPDTQLSSKENGNKAMKNRPYIAISFEENRKVQEEHQNRQGESNIIDDFQGSEEDNQSVLLYVQADQDGTQTQDDDESLRNGAEILASLNQGIPSQTTVVNSPKAVSSISTSPSSCQQHAILLTTPQQTNQAPKGHGSTNANSSTCQYIALPHEQTAIIDQLTAALQPGLQYMISGPLEAIMALPSALEQKQMVASNQKSSYDGPIISLQLSNDKNNVGM